MTSTRAARATPRWRTTAVAPLGVTDGSTPASGNAGPRALPRADTDQPSPSAVTPSAVASSAAVQARVASTFGSDQCSRPPRTEPAESTAMKGTETPGRCRSPNTSSGEPNTSE